MTSQPRDAATASQTGMVQRVVFLAVILGLSGLLVSKSMAQVQLEREVPVNATGLYGDLASGIKPQIVDMRPLVDDDNEDVGGFEYTHIPGSIPFPGCDPLTTPEGAMGQIQPGVPTVIVSAEGSADDYARCADVFSRARNLEGGMLGWMDEFYPEDEGEYTPPSMGAGGGCL
jgi:hypothetical protein